MSLNVDTMSDAKDRKRVITAARREQNRIAQQSYREWRTVPPFSAAADFVGRRQKERERQHHPNRGVVESHPQPRNQHQRTLPCVDVGYQNAQPRYYPILPRLNVNLDESETSPPRHSILPLDGEDVDYQTLQPQHLSILPRGVEARRHPHPRYPSILPDVGDMESQSHESIFPPNDQSLFPADAYVRDISDQRNPQHRHRLSLPPDVEECQIAQGRQRSIPDDVQDSQELPIEGFPFQAMFTNRICGHPKFQELMIATSKFTNSSIQSRTMRGYIYNARCIGMDVEDLHRDFRFGYVEIPHLQPTLPQLTIRHRSYLDLIPFPRLRAGAILVPHDAMEFKRDLFRGVVCYGRPWDLRSWEIADWFLMKWRFLIL